MYEDPMGLDPVAYCEISYDRQVPIKSVLFAYDRFS